jgi:lipid A 3-O-deacylase
MKMKITKIAGAWIAASLLVFGGGNIPTQPQTEAPDSTPWINTIGIGYGQSKDNIDIYRLTLRKDFSTRWWESGIGYLSGYWEGSLNYWNGRGDENFGIALSPVFVYYFQTGASLQPYLEGGIGVSLFSETRMGSRDLSSNFLFEDRIGAGVRVGDWDLSFRYMHYSNAGIEKPNDGIDIFIGSVNYRF